MNETNDPHFYPFLVNKASNLDGSSLGYKGVPAAYEGNSSDFKFNPSSPIMQLFYACENSVDDLCRSRIY